MAPIVQILEERFMSEFEGLANRVTSEFVNVRARAYSAPVGSMTEYQGHAFYVDCILTDASEDESDNVALSVHLMHLTTHPRINADVCWGHPSGYIEAELWPDLESSRDWPVATEETLEHLSAGMSRLFGALIDAIRRRRPGDL